MKYVFTSLIIIPFLLNAQDDINSEYWIYTIVERFDGDRRMAGIASKECFDSHREKEMILMTVMSYRKIDDDSEGTPLALVALSLGDVMDNPSAEKLSYRAKGETEIREIPISSGDENFIYLDPLHSAFLIAKMKKKSMILFKLEMRNGREIEINFSLQGSSRALDYVVFEK